MNFDRCPANECSVGIKVSSQALFSMFGLGYHEEMLEENVPVRVDDRDRWQDILSALRSKFTFKHTEHCTR